MEESTNSYRSRGDKIKDWLDKNKLRNQWMIAELAKRGLQVSESNFCHALSGLRKSPRAMMILSLSEEIIAEYTAIWSRQTKKGVFY